MINKVILVGNVGKDPDVRYFDNNEGVANFTLATTERGFTTRDGRQIPERTDWHNITVRRGLVKVAESYIKKGTQLYVEGKLRTRSYEQDGVTKYVTEVIADTVKLLGRKSDNPAVDDNTYNSGSNDSGAQPVADSGQNAAPQNQSAGNEGFNAGDNSNEQEDDLPF